MRIHDISLSIHPSLPVWPGDPPIEIEQLSAMASGADANVSSISCGVHIGTHVDAPLHFIDRGRTVDELALEVLVGVAVVVEIMDAKNIDSDVLDQIDLPDDAIRVLFKTMNSSFWAEGIEEFQVDYSAITPSGAAWLVERGIRLVGVDYLSVAPYDRPRETHELLLGNNIIIVEGLDLHKVQPGIYELYCLPVKLMGLEGAPARAVLVELD